MAVDEECPAAAPIRPWEATLVGVVGGEPVRVHWCGQGHAKQLLLAIGPDTTFSASLTPIAGKTVDECTAIAAKTRPERGAAEALCKYGASGNWYHARIAATHGDGAIVSCITTARGSDGAVVFATHLVFGFAGMFGNVAVEPGQAREFDWYAQVATDSPAGVSVPVRTAVATYDTECVANPAPPA